MIADEKLLSSGEFKLGLSPRMLATGLVVIIITAMVFALVNASRLVETYTPLHHAVMEIRLEAAIGHLWFEEIISGDRFKNITRIWEHLDRSEWYAKAMLNGGDYADLRIVPLHDPMLRKELEEVLVKIQELRIIAEQRWEIQSQSGVGSTIDQRFDAVFESLVAQAGAVDAALRAKMASDLADFKLLQILIVLVTLLLSYFFSRLFLRYEKYQRADLKLMAEFGNHIKAIADYTYDWESWISAEGKVMWINPGVEKITGYSVNECQNMPDYPLSLIHFDDKPGISELLTDALQNESVLENIEFRILHKSGKESWVSLSAQAIYDNNQTYSGLRTSIRDITQKINDAKRIRELNAVLENKVEERTRELQDANDKLKELDHLKSMFIASMSHELRTPLNSIIGFSGMLAGDMAGEITNQQRDYIQRINRAGHHLFELITEVIDISKIEAGKLAIDYTEFALDEVIKRAVEIVEPDVKARGLILQLSVAEALQMHSDKKRIYQCLINLLGNAIKYTERGVISLNVSRTGSQVDIIVKDTGTGISPDDQQYLFQPFVRLNTPLNATIGGTGLGLDLTRKLVREVLRGDIFVSSQDGQGSTFTLKIPQRVSDVKAINSQENVIDA